MSTRSEVLNWDGAFEYKDLKQLVHKQLLEEMDLESLRRLDDETARARVSDSIRNLLHRQRSPLTQNERDQMVAEVLCELFGLGPLEPLLADPTVSDILINGSRVVYVERYGRLERTEIHFDDDHHLSRIIDRIVSRVGRRVDESSPMVDARLPDGSRVNVIISPLSLQGPVVSIRRFGKDPLTANDLVAKDMLQAMNTGHEGSLTTIHANSPRDALGRLETMIAMANLNLPDKAIRQQIASAINVIVQVIRLPGGSRKVMSISEVVGMEGPAITMQDLYIY